MALRPNTTYYFRVKAINATSESPLSDSIAVTTLSDNSLTQSDVAAASSPILSDIVPSDTSLYITIVKPDDTEFINNYEIDVSTLSDFSNIVLSSKLNAATHLNETIEYDGKFYVTRIDSLSTETTYYVRARSVNLSSTSGYSNTLSATTLSSVPRPVIAGVINLSAIDGTVVWSEVTGATNYRIDVATDPAFTSLVVDDVSTSTTAQYAIPVLVENTVYYARVRAEINASTSSYSEPITFRSLDNIETYDNLSYVPDAPILTSINNIDVDGFIIKWLTSNENLTYTLEVATDSAFNTIVYTGITRDFELDVRGLTASTTYYYRLKGTKYIDSEYTTGQLSTVDTNIGLNPPSVVINTLILSTSFSVSIVQRSYATNYLVELATDSGFSDPRRVYTIDSSVRFTDLVPVTQYYVRVKALNSLNASNFSSVVSTTTENPLPAITLQNPTELTESAARLNWQENSVYTNYLLDIRRGDSTVSGLSGQLFKSLDIGYVGTYLVDLLLEPDTLYYYRLTGVTAQGDRKTTDWTAFSTLTPATTLAFNRGVLSWPANSLNKLEVSLSRDFRYCLPEWSPKSVDGTTKYPLQNVLRKYGSVYVRGYLDDGLKQSSNTLTIDTSNIEFIQDHTVTENSIKVILNSTDTRHKLDIIRLDGQSQVPVAGYTHPVILTNDWEYVFNGLQPSTTYIIGFSYLDTTSNSYIEYDSLTVKTHSTSDVFLDYTENNTIVTPGVTVTYVGDNQISVTTDSVEPIAIKASLWENLPAYLYYYEGNKTEHIIEVPANSAIYIEAVSVVNNEFSIPTKISQQSDVVTVEGVDVLNSISNISGIEILNTQQAIVNWSTVLEALDYNVEFSLSNTFDILTNTLSVSRLSQTSVLVSGINSTLIYYVRVQAFNRRYVGDYGTIAALDTTP